ncbi:ATP-binding protein [Nitrosopumilus sp.]|uniref:PAS domain-containing sensor histidine kinase n=1 Tax=Nitrosopumilus sp. TaxID=2024843 RepID=UPI00349FF75F
MIKNHQLEQRDNVFIKFYRQAYEDLPVMLRTIDKNGIIIECNNMYCHTLGYCKEEVVGKSIFEHVADESIKKLTDTFLRWKQTGKVGNANLLMKKKNGDIFPVLLNATNILDSQGLLVGSNTVISDITKLTELHDKVIKNEKIIKRQYDNLIKLTVQKDSFLAMVAHELKTPLVPIKSYTDILLQNAFGILNPKQKQIITQIKNSGESLEYLIGDLLDVQKMELNTFTLKQETHPLDVLINNSVENFTQNALDKKILITLSLIPNILCFCDSARLKQVLNNLILNAIDFCPQTDGKIHISLKQHGNNAYIIVRDNGIGIQKKVLSKIFSKFYQADSSMTRSHGGSGLGLTIAGGIIQSHGGKIFAKSEGSGKGTEIHIILPLSQEISKNV